MLYNDKVETVFAINYGAQFSKKNSSSQNGSISIGGSYSKIAFLGLRKGDPPLNHSFVPKNRGTTIWEKNLGIPSLLFQQGRPCVKVLVFVPLCKSYGFGPHKGKVPFRYFHSPWRFFGRNAIFTVNWEKRGG